MTHEAEIDFESRSDVNLKTRGSYVYFASPHTRVLIGSYRLDDGPVRRWRYPEPCPADLADAIASGTLVKAHNASFEYQCFDWLAEHLGWPMPDDTAFRCTMAIAASMGLPRDLDSLGTALNLSTQKDKEGRRLIQLFSVPRKPKKDEPEGIYFNEPHDMPGEFEKFHTYCDRDVETESAAAKRMVDLSEAEWAVYHLSERINRRGIRVDRTSAIAALKMAEIAKAGFDARMAELTGGAVRKCSEIAKLLAWTNAQGVPLASMAEADISDALADLDDMPGRVRAALDLRQEAAKTSVSKLAAMVNRASGDGRVRGTFQYHGAGPGRWTNSGVNFSNMPRPRHIFEEAHLRHGTLFDAIRTEDPETLRWLFPGPLGRPLDLISDAIRCFLWAAPGHEFVQADYNGIQGANAAWLAGEEWKLKALFEIKADPSLPDLYRRTAAAIMNLPVETVTKKHPLRQSVGKVSELALGFAGGVSAYYSMARNYNMRLAELHALYGPVWTSADEERREKAVKRYERCLRRQESHAHVLSREGWIACEIIKTGWREANSRIRDAWYAYEKAARDAIRSPGTVTSACRMSFIVKMGFLWAQAPSGECIAYAAPKLRDQVWAKRLEESGLWGDAEVMDRQVAEIQERQGLAKIEGATTPRITARGVDSTTHQWSRYPLYGGLFMENFCMRVERDILVHGMFKAEAAGYPIVAHNYDEAIAEVPRGFGSVKAFEELICELPPWAAGLPLTAGGWRGKRYRKE